MGLEPVSAEASLEAVFTGIGLMTRATGASLVLGLGLKPGIVDTSPLLGVAWRLALWGSTWW